MNQPVPGTAQLLGAYRKELIDAGIDGEVLPTLLIEAQRHLLASPQSLRVKATINGEDLVMAINRHQRKSGKAGLA